METTAELQARIAELEKINRQLEQEVAEYKQTEEGLQAQTREIEFLYEIISIASKADTLCQLLEDILQPTLELLDFEVGGIHLVDRDKGIAELACEKDVPEGLLRRIRQVPLDSPPFKTVFVEAEPLIIENLEQTEPDLAQEYGLASIISLPLFVSGADGGEVIGALNLAMRSEQRRSFSTEEKLILFAVGQELGSTVNRIRIEEELQRQKELWETTEWAQEKERYRALLDVIPYGVQETDASGIITYVNKAYHEIYGYEEGELLGKPIWEHLETEETREGLRQELARLVKEQPRPESYQAKEQTKDGRTVDVRVDWNYARDARKQVTGFVTVVTDITRQLQAEREHERLTQEVIEAQQRTLKELFTPIIPVMETPQGGIIVMPLIGSIDSMRARDVTRALLAGISQYQAKVVILDITGVPIVDSGVANHLNKTIQAARLKGAQTIITGISEAVAEAIVDLGIDWSGIQTLRDLQTGLVAALGSLGIKLSK